jgi:hypothetical protein
MLVRVRRLGGGDQRLGGGNRRLVGGCRRLVGGCRLYDDSSEAVAAKGVRFDVSEEAVEGVRLSCCCCFVSPLRDGRLISSNDSV